MHSKRNFLQYIYYFCIILEKRKRTIFHENSKISRYSYKNFQKGSIKYTYHKNKDPSNDSLATRNG